MVDSPPVASPPDTSTTAESLAHCTTAAAVRDRVMAMYGSDLGGRAGVIHVTAVWARDPDTYITININDAAPPSANDFFALNVARARADALITSGKILRAEPALVHDLQGPAAAGLTAWRAEMCAKPTPPAVLILTSGRDLPLAHPVFRGAAQPIIYTNAEAAARLGAAALPSQVLVVAAQNPDIRSALAYLQRDRGCHNVAIEAGPSTSRQLYEPPLQIDELMLSVFHGNHLPAAAQGRPFLTPAGLRERLPRSSPAYTVKEPSGVWRFYRLTAA